jgi:glycosyltransferase involved in cell wall biosynthesis
MTKTVEILLATFNGAPFLAQQLDSIIEQSYTDWHLTVRDDGSTDGTPDIINNYLTRYPDRITQVTDTDTNLGACGNFGRLLEYSRAPYTMFCDQDDVWLPEKIALTLEEMQRQEAVADPDSPVLVHTDLMVVDRDLRVLGKSLWAWQQTDPDSTTLNRLLMQNNATGCTMMVNRALLDLALPIPAAARMHDWWLALVAGAFGRSGVVREATVLYRQHGSNDSGAVLWDFLREARLFLDKSHREQATARRNMVVTALQRQGGEFLKRYGDQLGGGYREMLQVFATLSDQDFFMRRYLTMKFRFFYANPMMNVGMMLFR